MNTTRPSSLEVLEARIAPAAVLHLVDVDGDLVTITASKGTNADLAAAVFTSTPSGAVMGGVHIDAINLTGNPAFDGTDLTITAKPGSLGGDGLANVESIDASNLNIGTLTVNGDLQDFAAGKGTAVSKVKAINVSSTSGTHTWSLACSVDVLNVAHDLRGAEIRVTPAGATLGVLKVGGSIVGESSIRTGFVGVSDGTIGKVVIKGDIIGGHNDDCGVVTAKDILSVKLLGNLVGGPDMGSTGSGKIAATHSLGTVLIKGSVVGNDGQDSGLVKSDGKIGSVTIGGSLIGGSSPTTGAIFAQDSIGAVKIGRDIRGGTSIVTGAIHAETSIASLTVGGDIIGNSGSISGNVFTAGGNIGPVTIGGSMIGADGTASGSISSGGKLGNVKIGGDVVAGGTTSAGSIQSELTMGAVRIAGSLASNGNSVAKITANPIAGVTQLAIKSITVGGSVVNAKVFSDDPDAQFGPIKVGGDWVASSVQTGIDAGADMLLGTNDDLAVAGGNPAIFSKIASITIGGQVLGTSIKPDDHFGFVSQQIGAMTVHGIKIPLTTGRGNDTDTTDTHFILGSARDMTVHEVA